MSIHKFCLLFAGVFVLVGLTALTPVHAAPPTVFTVTTNADPGDGTCDGSCTLRDAILAANLASGAQTIEFDIPNMSGCTSANVCTITLGSNLPALDNDISIDGSVNSADITVDGASNYQPFTVNASKTVSIKALTLAHSSGVIGGAIFNQGTLTVTGSTFDTNNTSNQGGGIENGGGAILTIIDSTFSGNISAGCGGGINNDGALTVKGSTFVNNHATTCGGGISGGGTSMTIVNSTFNNNVAETQGGALHNNSSDTVRIINSTIVGNHANALTGKADLKPDAPLAPNYGGGIYQGKLAATFYLDNTILADNRDDNLAIDSDCVNVGTLGSGTHNLIKDTLHACGLTDGSNGNQVGVDPALSVLANNGGPTQTMGFYIYSPAIDGGDKTLCADATNVNNQDQRGELRNDLNCDIGAFEMVYGTIPPDSTTVSRIATGAGQTYTFGPALAQLTFESATQLSITLTKSAPGNNPPNNALPYTWDIFVPDYRHSAPLKPTMNLPIKLCYLANAWNAPDGTTLHIFHYNGSSWDDIGGTADDVTFAPYHCVGATYTGTVLSPFALAPVGPTSVDVTNLRGAFNVRGNVLVRFKTTNESQIAGFNLYRQNGTNAWRRLNANLKQAKHAGTALGDTYRFTDKNVTAGKTYRYKIEVKYLDGHSEWTNIIRVK